MVVDDNHRNLKLMGNLLMEWSYIVRSKKDSSS